ncbi:signal transduction histidine kinase [Gluconacetobacter sacchari DSM 12717]|uniref:histidine kinase n=2 Tax=Gluconacetobacter sacchari TaxID=92759 RepID=A0A7W4IFC9_9PROT|nr:HAMP domain-containing sensor histidine kinase [Gluconacetobacter sacchari]MBB2161866.1 HAMP domain-containing histidine kinase [Gluconacetobacter sacchari]GBQ19304.1 signal transduction histidine kinase [Gluconacetobacter sacchari DSM 12717]
MRLLPRSLTGRLLVTAGGALLLGITVSASVIAGVFGHFVLQTLDLRLDTEIALIARTLDRNPDHPAAALHAGDLPPFDQPGSGWVWEARGPFGIVRSVSLGGQALSLPPDPLSDRLRDPPPAPPDMPRPGAPFGIADALRLHGMPPDLRPMDGRDAQGHAVHYRVAAFGQGAGQVTIVTAAPREIVEQPLRAAATPLAESVLAMGGIMLAALAVQIRVGLRPVVRLRRMVAEVKAGRLRRIAVSEPTELVPLVEELDGLIVANENAVAQARTHVSNLAHGLKTPLASLKLDLADAPGAEGARLRLLVETMERHIRHHLGRARAGGGVASPAVILLPRLQDLAEALARIHAESPCHADLDVPSDLHVRCDPQDLDELLGNVLDNAWRHAAGRVRVTARADGKRVRITIEDDGRGLSDAEIDLVTHEGRRLDEQSAGTGFGLAITRELCALHGGSVMLERSTLGGLSVTIALRGA